MERNEYCSISIFTRRGGGASYAGVQRVERVYVAFQEESKCYLGIYSRFFFGQGRENYHLATGFEVSDLTFKGEYGGDADEHIAQSQYIVLKPDQLDDNDLLEKLDKTPAYDRPKDFRDNFDGSEKKRRVTVVAVVP